MEIKVIWDDCQRQHHHIRHNTIYKYILYEPGALNDLSVHISLLMTIAVTDRKSVQMVRTYTVTITQLL